MVDDLDNEALKSVGKSIAVEARDMDVLDIIISTRWTGDPGDLLNVTTKGSENGIPIEKVVAR